MNHLGLCAIAKDEDDYLREWIFHHYMIGVERFIIYDNESRRPIAETLADLAAAKLVEVREIEGKSMQLPAYADCLRRDRDNFYWLGFLDLDEFIILKKHRDLRLLLAEYQEESGLALHWRVFGSSGHIRQPSGLVLENFTGCLHQDQARMHVKCLLRPERVSRVVDPHTFEFSHSGYCVDENRFPILNAIGPYTERLAVINHYHFKSQQEYEVKTAKGRSDAFELSASRNHASFVRQSQAPRVERPVPTAHLAALRQALAEGKPRRNAPVDSRVFYPRPLHEITEYVQACLESGQRLTAETLLAVLRPLYPDQPEFLQLDFLAALAGRDFAAAEKRLLKLISRQPALEHYYQLYLLWKRERREVKPLIEFIRLSAGMKKISNHPVLDRLSAEEG